MDQPTTVRILAGGHFFVGDAAKVLVDAVTDDLGAGLRDDPERLG
jgi:surfactin synthase thioesterase subunit